MAASLHCLFGVSLIVAISVIQGNAPSRLFYIVSSMIKDEGRATNCGPPGYNSSITWTPKVINIHQKTTFHIDVVAPHDFGSGDVKLTVSIPHSGTTLVQIDKNITCETLKKSIPKIKCPIKKNDHIAVTMEREPGSEIPLPKFPVNLTIILKNSKKNVVVCMYSVVKIIS